MILQKLINALRDADPVQRIQALRILALVEETRAINAIMRVYKQDVDPKVREVAKWAGSLIWQAQKRGHTTEAAINTHFKFRSKEEHAERLADSLIINAGEDDLKMQNQMMRIKAEWERLDAVQSSFKKTDTQIMDEMGLGLLEAGLSDEFRLLITDTANLV